MVSKLFFIIILFLTVVQMFTQLRKTLGCGRTYVIGPGIGTTQPIRKLFDNYHIIDIAGLFSLLG
jgi:hypothetical protein